MLLVCVYNAIFIGILDNPAGICSYIFVFFWHNHLPISEFISRSWSDMLRDTTTVFCTY